MDEYIDKKALQDMIYEEDDVVVRNKLKDVMEEISQYVCDWEYGDTVIKDSEFPNYAKEWVEGCYDLSSMPYFVTDAIDWDEVTNELLCDYSEFDINGTTYYGRS